MKGAPHTHTHTRNPSRMTCITSEYFGVRDQMHTGSVSKSYSDVTANTATTEFLTLLFFFSARIIILLLFPLRKHTTRRTVCVFVVKRTRIFFLYVHIYFFSIGLTITSGPSPGDRVHFYTDHFIDRQTSQAMHLHAIYVETK